jgi:hypothetical protein
MNSSLGWSFTDVGLEPSDFGTRLNSHHVYREVPELQHASLSDKRAFAVCV